MLSVKHLKNAKWNKELANFPEANFLQSENWLKVHDNLGMQTGQLGVFKNDKLEGLISYVVKDARRGRYIEVAGGPLLNWKDESVIEFITKELKIIANKHKAVFVRVRPQLLKSIESEEIFIKNGYKKAPMHLHAEHTSILDLTQTEEEMLKNMRRQTRYEVKKASRLNVKVKKYEAKEKIDQFINLQQETAKRQGFVTSSEKFLKTLTEVFSNDANIYVSTKDGPVLNMGLVLKSGQEVDYFEAASTPQSYKLPGSYGLLWQAIKDAKQAKYKRFNFWGIAYSNDPKNRYAGVTTFKRGFGGEDITYLPAQDLIINNNKYAFNWLVETARRKKRRL